jgi:hypothetical protein
MSYPYEDLEDGQFETLVVCCARKLFGLGVQSFAAGPDGGRDARFHGVAERYPSAAGPWTGLTIIQAKHTISLNSHFGESGFSGRIESSVLTEEIKRIKKLVQGDGVENYLLFSNRRLGGIADEAIIDRIVEETGMRKSSVALAGIEYLDLMLHEYTDILRLAKIDPLDQVLAVSSYEIAEVILAISEQLHTELTEIDAPIVERVSFDEKNNINNMSDSFARYLKKKYLVYTSQIEEFLAHPANKIALRYYEGAVEEFQLKIIAKRHKFQSFDNLFNHLVDLLVGRDGTLRSNKALLRAMIFYMYWHCDIGESANVDAQ